MMQTGTQIDRFTLVRHIGTGGTSEVWEVVDAEYKKFAAKIFSPGRRLDPDVLADFKAQIELTKALEHENLALPLTWGDHEGSPFIIFHYYQTSLMKLVNERKAARDLLGNLNVNLFKEEEVARILFDAASGLEYLHANKIKHRDIKPDNILVAIRPNGVHRYVISDFGASVDLKRTIIKQSQLSNSGNLGLTPDYASPEQFDGKDHLESDIFSLGVSLFEACAGQLPFPRLNAAEMVRSGKPIPKLPDGYSNRLYQLVVECLALDPELRPKPSKLREKAEFYLENGYWQPEEKIPTPPPSFCGKICKITFGTALFLGIFISGFFFLLPKSVEVYRDGTGKYGLRQGSDEITPPLYNHILPFRSEEVITVREGQHCKWINGKGDELLPGHSCKVCKVYKNADEFQEDINHIKNCKS